MLGLRHRAAPYNGNTDTTRVHSQNCNMLCSRRYYQN